MGAFLKTLETSVLVDTAANHECRKLLSPTLCLRHLWGGAVIRWWHVRWPRHCVWNIFEVAWSSDDLYTVSETSVRWRHQMVIYQMTPTLCRRTVIRWWQIEYYQILFAVYDVDKNHAEYLVEGPGHFLWGCVLKAWHTIKCFMDRRFLKYTCILENAVTNWSMRKECTVFSYAPSTPVMHAPLPHHSKVTVLCMIWGGYGV
jgi:hypothetical protein